MSRLSVVVITKDEESNLGRCLASVAWADEIVVVDNQSTDDTREIAADFGARVFCREWRGFGPAKQEGAGHATGDWILSLDADEEVTVPLADEIRRAIGDHGGTVGYLIPRRTEFLGRWIYHCGWYPDPVLRLFRKDSGSFNDAVVHERVELEGPVGRLKCELLHYSYPSLEKYFDKFNSYTSLAAEEAYKNGRKALLLDLAVRPISAFVKHYFIKLGFLDGVEGFLVSLLSSGYVLVKYAKLRDLTRKRRTAQR
ncbi:MAG TPA: glycosyltransferase family 2 protein [Acidobacteriota bacterium]|nr:glycosyltransferase family 2 protein [Acidobacteriota bacterium]